MIDNLNLFIAFAAGLISFFSPCVVVIIPIFLTSLAGVKFADIEESSLKKHLLHSTLVFVAGFILVFTLFGMVSGLFARVFTNYISYFNVVAGVLIIFFGLVMLELLPINIFARTFVFKIEKTQNYNLFKSFIVGAAFAAGWTPCVGPILAAILLLAGSSETVFEGGLYLLMYGLGLALPFLVFALFISKISIWIKKLNPFLRYFNFFAGILLIALGVLLLTNRLGEIASYFYFLNPPSM